MFNNGFCPDQAGSGWNTKQNQSVPQTPQIRFGSYFLKEKIFTFRKESIFPFRKNHPLSEDTKFKLPLCMSLMFGALRNISFNYDDHILKFFTEGFKNLPSSLFQFRKSVIKF